MRTVRVITMLGATASLACVSAAWAEDPPAGNQNSGSVFETAQGNLETVVVTARRRSEDVEKIPVAVTAFSGEELKTHDVRSAFDLQNFTPSLSVSGELSSRSDEVFTIRGQSQPFGGADPGVQTYFAEVPFPASQAGIFYDLDNVQVLKGPQGTLFGKNTTGGAVLFEPNRPTDQFGGYIDGQYGNYNFGEFKGVLNVPIVSDKLDVRLAADMATRSGFTTDISTGQTLDNIHYTAFRGSVEMRPFEGFENYAVFSYLHDHNDGTGAKLTAIDTGTITTLANTFLKPLFQIVGIDACPPKSQLPGFPNVLVQEACGSLYDFEKTMRQGLALQNSIGPRQTTSNIPLSYRRDTWSVIDVASYDVTDHIRIRNIFGYLSDKQQPAFDYDGSDVPLLDIPNTRAWESNSLQVTDEFQVLGETPDNSLNWIVGFYHELDHPGGYAEVGRQQFGGVQIPPTSIFAFFGTTEFQALNNGGTTNAVFGQASYNLTDKLTLTAGGRYTWDHKVANSAVCTLPQTFQGPCPLPIPSDPKLFGFVHQTANFRAPSWTLAADYQVTPDTMTYITYRRGYKSGGFNSGATDVPTDIAEFKPEYLTDVELGTKNNWTILGVPGRTNFDLYYGWYQDVQKNDLVEVCAVAGCLTAPSFDAITFNAAKANIKGLEFESTFVPDENFEVTAFYSYTDANYDKFVLPARFEAGVAVDPLNHAGNPFAYSPRHKFGATAQVHLPVDASYGSPYFTATWYEQSKVWFSDLSDLEPGASQGTYDLVNLRLDWNNVMGSSLDASAFVDNVTDRTYKVAENALLHLTGTSASIYGPPRMFGLEVRYSFGAGGE